MDIVEAAEIIRDDYLNLTSAQKERFDFVENTLKELDKTHHDELCGVVICWAGDAVVRARLMEDEPADSIK